MASGSDGRRPRESEVPLELLTPPWWIRGVDWLEGSAPEPSAASISGNTGRRRAGATRDGRSPGSPHGDPAAAHALTERLRTTLRARHYSRRTEKSYTGWVRRFPPVPIIRETAALGRLVSGRGGWDGWTERVLDPLLR